MDKVRSCAGDTVPQILWKYLGRDDDALEEVFYELNPGIEQYGVVLPAGVVMRLPEVVESAPAKVVNVWD